MIGKVGLCGVMLVAVAMIGCKEPSESSCAECTPVDKVTIVCPSDGATVKVGSTVNIKWCQAANRIPDFRVVVGVNQGEREIDITSEAIVDPVTSFQWTVPGKLVYVNDEYPLAGTTVTLRVHEYNNSRNTSDEIVLNITN